MSSPIADIEYLIKTKSDLSGLQAYVREQQSLIEAQRSAGQSTDRLDAGLRELIRKYNSALAKAKEATTAQLEFKASLDKVEESLIRVTDASVAQKAAAASPNGVVNEVGRLASSGQNSGQNKDQGLEIRNAQQYEQAVALHAALMEQVSAKQLLGAETATLTGKIGILNAALSTESALSVAAGIESKAQAEAESELAIAMNEGAKAARQRNIEAQLYAGQQLAAQEAVRANTEAEKEALLISDAVIESKLREAAATGKNTLATNEFLVVSRELMSGRINRLPGSLSILGGAFGLVGGAVTGATIALFMGAEAFKKYLEIVKDTRNELVLFNRDAEKAQFALEELSVKQLDATEKFYDQLDKILSKSASITESMERLNRAQEESSKLSDALAKTREAAGLSAAEDIKDPVGRAQAEYRLKQSLMQAQNADADRLGREQYKNQEDAVTKAGQNVVDQAKKAEDLKKSLDDSETALTKAKEQRTEQQKLLESMRKLGLDENQISAVMSGKSLSDLTIGRGTQTTTIDPLSGNRIVSSQSADYQPPSIGFLTPGKMDAFTQLFKQYQSQLGGQTGEQQDARVHALQARYDTNKTAYDDASKAANDLATEFEQLNKQLQDLGQTLNSASQLRNQNAITEQIKNLQAVKQADEDALAGIERGHPTAASRQQDSELKQAIQQLTAMIERLGTGAKAQSTAFSYFAGGKVSGPTDLAPNLDVSGVVTAIQNMKAGFQRKLDELQRQIQSN